MQAPAPTNENVLLSRRERPFVGWVAIDEFEDLFAEIGGARVVVPKHRPSLPHWAARVRNRLVSDVSVHSDLGSGELLFVVARTPSDLQVVRTLNAQRRRFRHVVGYVIDAYFQPGFGSATKHYDHIFTTTAEGAEFVRKRFGVPSSVLYQGFDCLRWGSVNDERAVDLLGYGRQPASYHQAFRAAFHRQESPLLYLHSPIGSMDGPAVWTERAMLLKLMQRTKLALAFHMMVEPQGSRPKSASFVTSRWFEQLTAGCVVVGKRPSMAPELFPWPDATLELPDSPAAAVDFVTTLATDARFLTAARRRNVLEMYRRHDWRYRIRDVFRHFDLPLPDRLQAELAELDMRIQQLGTSNARAEALYPPLSTAAQHS
jgi:hypothetical protein